ncbi:phosphoribosyltransferase family protein [Kordia sp.]|uniref:ComF family protein n=1 Tax=Kordia sp. TaxID=1965332 RepID=UPI0025BA98A0|nr:phosphoribosyltransferase family protein [Kordia sp.]MCH2193352.1 ComF family protein [Kordia sp.]
MANILNNILSSFFPATCLGCSDKLMHQEQDICTKCLHNLPFTEFHKHTENPVKQTFYGRVHIENATALLHYKKNGIVQQLIHHLKYKDRQDVGNFLGNMLGERLKKEAAYTNIDYIIPVPLHKKRLQKRGYNQVTNFGQELAKHLEAVYVDDILIKINNIKTQAFKKRAARWLTAQHSFEVTDTTLLQGKHILLVDDIITTGATLEACTLALQKIPNIKISVATMSIAS